MGGGQRPTLQPSLHGGERRESDRVGLYPGEKTTTHGSTWGHGDKRHSTSSMGDESKRAGRGGVDNSLCRRICLNDKAAGGSCANPNRLDKDRQPELSGDKYLGIKYTHFDGELEGIALALENTLRKTQAW